MATKPKVKATKVQYVALCRLRDDPEEVVAGIGATPADAIEDAEVEYGYGPCLTSHIIEVKLPDLVSMSYKSAQTITLK